MGLSFTDYDVFVDGAKNRYAKIVGVDRSTLNNSFGWNDRDATEYNKTGDDGYFLNRYSDILREINSKSHKAAVAKEEAESWEASLAASRRIDPNFGTSKAFVSPPKSQPASAPGSNPSFGDSISAAKDLAQWRLGLDKQAMQNAHEFRDLEANRDFGFQNTLQTSRQTAEQKLEDTRQSGDTGRLGMQIGSNERIENTRQSGDTGRLGMQIGSNERLENTRQSGMSARQSEQLQNQRTMQDAGFNQQRTMQAIQAARARRLFAGAGGF